MVKKHKQSRRVFTYAFRARKRQAISRDNMCRNRPIFRIQFFICNNINKGVGLVFWIISFTSNMTTENMYICYCEKTLEAVVFDPGHSFKETCNFIKENNLNLKAILLTHGHFEKTIYFLFFTFLNIIFQKNI